MTAIDLIKGRYVDTLKEEHNFASPIDVMRARMEAGELLHKTIYTSAIVICDRSKDSYTLTTVSDLAAFLHDQNKIEDKGIEHLASLPQKQGWWNLGDTISEVPNSLTVQANTQPFGRYQERIGGDITKHLFGAQNLAEVNDYFSWINEGRPVSSDERIQLSKAYFHNLNGVVARPIALRTSLGYCLQLAGVGNKKTHTAVLK